VAKILEASDLKLKFEPAYDNAQALLCPRCGSANLHHETVLSFHRAEEDGEVLMTRIEGAECIVNMPVNNLKNPSRRRGAVRVGFCCESCDKVGHVGVTLNIIQHKGVTYFEWCLVEA